MGAEGEWPRLCTAKYVVVAGKDTYMLRFGCRSSCDNPRYSRRSLYWYPFTRSPRRVELLFGYVAPMGRSSSCSLNLVSLPEFLHHICL